MRIKLLLFLGFMVLFTPTYGVDIREYEFVRHLWLQGQIQESIATAEQALKKEKKEALWYALLDDIYKSLPESSEQRIANLEKGLRVKKLSNVPDIKVRLAQAYFDAGQYPKAQALYEEFPRTAFIQLQLKNCQTADSLRKHPLSYGRHPLSEEINTEFDNLWPSITIDGQFFCTTVVNGKKTSVGLPNLWNEDLYIAQKVNQKWAPTQALPSPINTKENEGASCFSADGNYMFFVRCQDPNGLGSCDIYYIYKQADHWSDPINAGAMVNSSYWESTPCLSPSGTELIFSSNRPGGVGGQDLYQCKVHYLPNGRLGFTEAINLGAAINTSWNEIAPFISANGQELYFSSNGWPGMGGMDIFKVKWKVPQEVNPLNLGYPLNTYQDEIGFRLNIDGQHAYLAAETDSQRIIYEIDLPKERQTEPMICLQGKVIDAESGQPSSAYIMISDTSQSQPIFSTWAHPKNGNFVALLRPNTVLELSAEKAGYAFSSQLIHPSDSSLTIALQPIRMGAQFNLHHIYFDWNQATPQKGSEKELDQLVKLMQNYPLFHFILIGHTDQTGNEAYNQELSMKRAKSVAEYCILHGINADRITCQGKGSAAPIDSNNTELGRQRNRRIEVILRIIEKKDKGVLSLESQE